MRCKCGSGETVVKDSRPIPDGTIMRRRLCLGCGVRFTTNEIHVEDYAKIRKVRDGISNIKKDIFKLASVVAEIEALSPTTDLQVSASKSSSEQAIERDH